VFFKDENFDHLRPTSESGFPDPSNSLKSN